MNILPMHDYLVVKERKTDVSTGGIFTGFLVDDGATKELIEGEVLAVGPGRKDQRGVRDDMWDLAPGMVVKFSPVMSVPVAGEDDVLMIRRDAVAGVVA